MQKQTGNKTADTCKKAQEAYQDIRMTSSNMRKRSEAIKLKDSAVYKTELARAFVEIACAADKKETRCYFQIDGSYKFHQSEGLPEGYGGIGFHASPLYEEIRKELVNCGFEVS